MLGLIVSIMNNYGLTEEHIAQQIKYNYEEANQYSAVYSDSNEEEFELHYENNESTDSDTSIPLTPVVTEVKTKFTFKTTPFSSSWASDDEEEEYDLKPFVPTIKKDKDKDQRTLESPKNSNSKKDDKKMYVAHRRDFRDALSSGTKICANYIDCMDDDCPRFHVLKENLCPHAGRNNYCNENDCDKIVIKSCRKGKRCSDSTCSFRH
jgi:hypothetical protein